MQLKDSKILITGAAGFIGSHLADRLAEGNELVLVDDFSIGVRQNLAGLEGRPDISIVEADVTDRACMEELLEGVRVVFHLAISCLRTSLQDPQLSHDVNAGGTLSTLMAAHRHRVQRFLYVSSSEVYGTAQRVPMDESHPLSPTTVYGASKLAGEHYALAYWHTHGLPVCVVRPFNTYGPREPYQGARAEVIPRFILQLEAGRRPVIYGDGNQTRDFTFVEDTVTGLVRAAECEELIGDVVNVAFGTEVSIARIAELLADAMDRPGIAPKFADARPADVLRHYADVSKARRLFGFEPRTDITAGLARTVEWFRAQGIAARPGTEAAGTPNWT